MSEFKDTIIINKDLLLAYSPITDNTALDDIIPFVSIAQLVHIVPIIGEALFDELKNQIENNNLTEESSALIVKIAAPLSLWACYEAAPFHYMKWVNKGITIKNSENSTSPSMKDIAQWRLFISNSAETLNEQLIKFLCKCKDDYPLWNPHNENCCNRFNKNEFGSNKQRFDSGIFFKRKNNGCSCGC